MQLLETIKAENGIIAHLPYHQRRLERSLKTLGFTEYHQLSECLEPPKNGLIRCRVLYDETNIHVTYHPYAPRRIATLQAIIDDTIEYALKYADRSELDALFAQRGIADEILVVKNGLVTDTTIANIAFYDNGQWLTPKEPLLHGTTRERLLDEGYLVEADIPIEKAPSYTKCALMNAMVGFMEIENGIILPK